MLEFDNIDKLDTSGTNCPIPINMTKSKFCLLPKGALLLVIATDPHFTIDLSVFLKRSGNNIIKSWQENDKHFFLLEKVN